MKEIRNVAPAPDYSALPDHVRISSLIPGDPISDYHGMPDVQRELLRAEKLEQSENASEGICQGLGKAGVSHIHVVEAA